VSRLHTHYDNLKVSRDAPDFVIRAAYKTLTQRCHPDKHPGDERAARIMSTINSSYEVLSDPERRADHDAWIVREEVRLARQEPRQPEAVPIPPHWQQPEPVPAESSHTGYKRILARLLGDMIPTMSVLLSTFSRLIMAGLLFGVILLLYWLVPKPTPSPGPKPYQAQMPAQQATSAAISDCRAIPYSYKAGGKDRGSFVYSYVRNGRRHFSSRKPVGCGGGTTAGTAPSSREPSHYFRPSTAPNGRPWPAKAAYIGGYPVDNDDGYSKVTIDNTRNDSDVFVKLVSLDNDVSYPVRQFFIPAQGRFTMNKVSGGRYDIRYRDLDSGGLSRSEAFDVEEMHTANGVQFSDITMTLYKVQDGNFQTYDLADSEF
jgi:curved DNA-binding protein CbpA